jgi:hypothetical protein
MDEDVDEDVDKLAATGTAQALASIRTHPGIADSPRTDAASVAPPARRFNIHLSSGLFRSTLIRVPARLFQVVRAGFHEGRIPSPESVLF